MTGRPRSAGGRETIEPGIYRRHRTVCKSSHDDKPGRRCGCSLQVAVPGVRPRETRIVTIARGATVAEARQQRRRLLAAGRPTEPTTTTSITTVHELAVAYLRAKTPLLAPSTILGTEDAYRLSVAPYLRDVPLAQLNRGRVEAWVALLLTDGASPHAARKALAALRVMCSSSSSVTSQRIRARECASQSRSRTRTRRRRSSAFSLPSSSSGCSPPARRAAWRRSSGSPPRPACDQARWAGCAGPTSSCARAASAALWRKTIKLPKSGRPRRVAMTVALADCLAKLYRIEVVENGRDADGYVFVGRDGRSPISDYTPLEVVQRVQRRAGVTVPG